MGTERSYDGKYGYPPMALKLGAGFTKTVKLATPERLAAASTPCLLALVQPRVDNDTCLPLNTKVVKLGNAADNWHVVLPPAHPGIVLPVGDLYDVWLKAYADDEGVDVTPLVDPAA